MERVEFIHSFYIFLKRSFKSTITRIRSWLQHWYCVGVNTLKRYRQLREKDLPKVSTWQLDSNLRPFGRKARNLPLCHYVPPIIWIIYICYSVEFQEACKQCLILLWLAVLIVVELLNSWSAEVDRRWRAISQRWKGRWTSKYEFLSWGFNVDVMFCKRRRIFVIWLCFR